MDWKIRTINKTEVSIIKGLWEKLNRIHLHDSHYFKDHYKKFTFEKRSEKFIRLADQNILIQVVENKELVIIGYCVSSIHHGIGEIDSIYIEKEYRKYGIGGKLIEAGINWLKERECEKITLAVAEGHEEVFEFYKKYGFYPRKTVLELKDLPFEQIF